MLNQYWIKLDVDSQIWRYRSAWATLISFGVAAYFSHLWINPYRHLFFLQGNSLILGPRQIIQGIIRFNKEEMKIGILTWHSS